MLKITTANGAIVRVDNRTKRFALLAEPHAAEPLHFSNGKFMDCRAEVGKSLILRFGPKSAAFMSKAVAVEHI